MNDARHPLDQLPDLAAGRLDPQTAAELDRHIRSCAACAAELAELQALADALGPDRAAEPRPETLNAILDRLPAEPSAPGPGGGPLVDLDQARTARRQMRRPVMAGLVAAAAALVAFVAVAITMAGSGENGSEVATPPAPGDPSAQQVMLAAASATSELETTRTTMSGEVHFTPDLGDLEIDSLNVGLRLEGESELAFPDRAHTSVSIEALEGPASELFESSRFEQIIVGSDVWMRTDDGPWQTQEAGEEGFIDLPSLEEPAELLERAAEDAEALDDGGIVDIDGVETRQVGFTVPGGLLGLDALLEEDHHPVAITVFIGPDEHLRRAEISLDAPVEAPLAGTMAMELTVDYVAFDVPVDIEPPDVED